jgi:dGTPase
MRTRTDLETLEARSLQPWAQRSDASLGRARPESPHPLRTCYQRDKARIIHSRAFRRLEYKTQVFLNGSGDHLRTRLTHTIEVASITRTIARALGLNEDLAEAIALAHDLGHPPVGHSGEETLDALMREHGGFDHNAQSLRVVEALEERMPGVPGLNLSYEVLEGLRKHDARHEVPGEPPGARNFQPTLEAQVANLADEIAYYSHDLDDGIDAGLLERTKLAELAVWSRAEASVRRAAPRLEGRLLHRAVIRAIIDREVENTIAASARAIAASGVGSVADVRRQRARLIRYSPAMAAANRELRAFLYANLYYHPAVARVNRRACGSLRAVFAALVAQPRRLGRDASRRVPSDGIHRAVCDYVAGMTDRYLAEAFARLGKPG